MIRALRRVGLNTHGAFQSKILSAYVNSLCQDVPSRAIIPDIVKFQLLSHQAFRAMANKLTAL